MTKEAALKAFFSGFGGEQTRKSPDGTEEIASWDVYTSTSVKPNAALPYISYEVVTDSFFGAPVSLTVQLWDYASQESPINAKVREIAEAIGGGGIMLPCDGGMIWLKRGSPWCINASGEGDNNVKVRQLNVEAEYLTLN